MQVRGLSHPPDTLPTPSRITSTPSRHPPGGHKTRGAGPKPAPLARSAVGLPLGLPKLPARNATLRATARPVRSQAAIELAFGGPQGREIGRAHVELQSRENLVCRL